MPTDRDDLPELEILSGDGGFGPSPPPFATEDERDPDVPSAGWRPSRRLVLAAFAVVAVAIGLVGVLDDDAPDEDAEAVVPVEIDVVPDRTSTIAPTRFEERVVGGPSLRLDDGSARPLPSGPPSEAQLVERWRDDRLDRCRGIYASAHHDGVVLTSVFSNTTEPGTPIDDIGDGAGIVARRADTGMPAWRLDLASDIVFRIDPLARGAVLVTTSEELLVVTTDEGMVLGRHRGRLEQVDVVASGILAVDRRTDGTDVVLFDDLLVERWRVPLSTAAVDVLPGDRDVVIVGGGFVRSIGYDGAVRSVLKSDVAVDGVRIDDVVIVHDGETVVGFETDGSERWRRDAEARLLFASDDVYAQASDRGAGPETLSVRDVTDRRWWVTDLPDEIAAVAGGPGVFVTTSEQGIRVLDATSGAPTIVLDRIPFALSVDVLWSWGDGEVVGRALDTGTVVMRLAADDVCGVHPVDGGLLVATPTDVRFVTAGPR